MEQMLDEVERSCPDELYRFVGCVEKNPSTWVHSCDQMKRDLTQCSHTRVNGLAATTKVRSKPQCCLFQPLGGLDVQPGDEMPWYYS